MSDIHDPLPAMVASIDQLIALLPQLTRTLFSYRNQLIGEGFPPEEAIILVAKLQERFFND